jgi:hypothetical protein
MSNSECKMAASGTGHTVQDLGMEDEDDGI